MLSIPWTMTAELFPHEIRELGHAFAFSVANVIMFVAIQNYRWIFLILSFLNSNGILIFSSRNLIHLFNGSEYVQWFFAGVSMLGFLFALFFLPETHGKKLSEIQAYFESKSNKNLIELKKTNFSQKVWFSMNW